MKKRIKDIVVLTVFFITMTASIILFLNLNTRRNNETVLQYEKSFETILSINADLISAGYFMWDEFYLAFEQNNIEFISEILDELKELMHYTSELSIKNYNYLQIDKAYKINRIDNEIFIDFPIFNDYQTKMIEGKMVQIKIDSEKILLNIQQNPSFTFLKGTNEYPFSYGLLIKSNNPSILFFQIVSSICVGLLFALIMRKVLYNHSHYFYQTRGLEKIIFLFEHTEKYSADHSKHVATIAYIIGRKLGFKGKDLKDLKVAALLHDIGKISIPREILNKKEKLTDEEFELIKEHPRLSDNILKSFEELSHLRPYIKYHHEKLDGSGYPSGLKGKDIPIQSRIIAIADIFEALTGERPYRSPMPPQNAVTFMETMSIDKDIHKILNENLIEICIKIDRKSHYSE